MANTSGNIDDPVAIAGVNNKIRPYVDDAHQLCEETDNFIAWWNTALQGSSIGTLFPADTTPVRDSANPESGTADGRSQWEGIQVQQILAFATAFQSLLSANNNQYRNLLSAMRTNGLPRF